MNKWQAVVFDLDDTLYPERDYVLSGFRAVAAWAETHWQIPANQGFAELRHLFNQGIRGDTFNRWLALHGRDTETFIKTLIQVYRDHEPVLTPFAEVPGLLKTLRQKYPLGLLTDGYLAVQQRKLAALNLAGYFAAVVYSDEWGRNAWKPNPKPFQAVLERLHVANAAQAVYIGDNPTKDFLGARRLGMATVWLRRLGGEYSQLKPPTADHVPDIEVTSLAQLGQALMQVPAPD